MKLKKRFFFSFFSTTNRSRDEQGVFDPPVGDGKSGVPVGRGLIFCLWWSSLNRIKSLMCWSKFSRTYYLEPFFRSTLMRTLKRINLTCHHVARLQQQSAIQHMILTSYRLFDWQVCVVLRCWRRLVLLLQCLPVSRDKHVWMEVLMVKTDSSSLAVLKPSGAPVTAEDNAVQLELSWARLRSLEP